MTDEERSRTFATQSTGDVSMPDLASTLNLSVSRRALLQRAVGVGVGVPVAMALIAACGDEDDEPDPVDEPDDPVDAPDDDDDVEDDEEPEEPDEPEDEPDDEPVDVADGGTLVIGLNLQSETLDPHFSGRLADRYIMYAIFNTIVAYDEDFNLDPDLAASWEIDDSGLNVTFSLQPDVVFHDGTPCDAEAVKWNIERVKDPDVNSPQRAQLAPIDTVEVIDDTTVQFTLVEARRPILAALGERPGFVVSPAAVEEFGDGFGRNPVGSGPFRFVEWVDGQRVVIERNDDYWDPEKPYLDAIEYRHIPDPPVRLTAVRTGEIHIADEMAFDLLDPIQDDPEVTIESLQSGRINVLWWHLDREPWSNADFRKAVVRAIDREQVQQIIYNGTGRVSRQPIGGGWAYDPSLDEEAPGHDLDAALEFIEASGLAGETFPLSFASTPETSDLVQLLQSQIEQIGITIELDPRSPADVAAMFQEGRVEWATSSWAPRADPDGLLPLLFHSNGARSHGYSNPEVDALLDEAATMFDTDEAAELYHEAALLIAEDAPMVFLHNPEVFAVRRNEVEGFVYHPDLILRLRDLRLSGA